MNRTSLDNSHVLVLSNWVVSLEISWEERSGDRGEKNYPWGVTVLSPDRNILKKCQSFGILSSVSEIYG